MAQTTVCEYFRSAAKRLAGAGSMSPEAEARLLLGETLRIPPAAVPAADRELASDEETTLELLLRRREAHEPLQYLLGKAYFHDIELEVSPTVLIPRPETELLVQWAIETLPKHGRLLDLGTGSGAVALAVAHARPDVKVTATDVSMEALRVAGRNCRRLGCENVEFLRSDLCAALGTDARFDAIAANLPYVPEEDRNTLAPEVLLHEPALALFSGPDGTHLLLRAVREIVPHLVPGGAACFELDPRQAERLRDAFAAAGFSAEIRRDLAGRDRFVAGRLPK